MCAYLNKITVPITVSRVEIQCKALNPASRRKTKFILVFLRTREVDPLNGDINGLEYLWQSIAKKLQASHDYCSVAPYRCVEK